MTKTKKGYELLGRLVAEAAKQGFTISRLDGSGDGVHIQLEIERDEWPSIGRLAGSASVWVTGPYAGGVIHYAGAGWALLAKLGVVAEGRDADRHGGFTWAEARRFVEQANERQRQIAARMAAFDAKGAT